MLAISRGIDWALGGLFPALGLTLKRLWRDFHLPINTDIYG
jgi:hypothetical protein